MARSGRATGKCSRSKARTDGLCSTDGTPAGGIGTGRSYIVFKGTHGRIGGAPVGPSIIIGGDTSASRCNQRRGRWQIIGRRGASCTGKGRIDVQTVGFAACNSFPRSQSIAIISVIKSNISGGSRCIQVIVIRGRYRGVPIIKAVMIS